MYALYLPLGLALSRWLINLGILIVIIHTVMAALCLLTLQPVLCKDGSTFLLTLQPILCKDWGLP